jgi:hypothetical protein
MDLDTTNKKANNQMNYKLYQCLFCIHPYFVQHQPIASKKCMVMEASPRSIKTYSFEAGEKRRKNALAASNIFLINLPVVRRLCRLYRSVVVATSKNESRFEWSKHHHRIMSSQPK